ncbi:DUF448 domain-containing protein [Campylobacter sp.]|uniref:DUF448 domain-containing protein n=1 Tax=Campylobacter sp. TaxID=205 RepID=UPI002A81926C|nr:DUF448 domain-containing protein [Campylobacter sp.]MDY4444888.1 DUF448 domain-containing protein [Campylobacter sp.]
MRKSHQPIRMCVVCRMRIFQHKLARFASIDGKIIKNPKNCRSFYLCQNCLQKDEKILRKALGRFGTYEKGDF